MAVDPPMTQQTPLERYTVIHELGRGAIGRVYAARDRSTGADVALKTLDPALFKEADANLAELFLKNAQSAARLRHRNIVKVHDAGEGGGTAYVAMELLEGESLRHLLEHRPPSTARAIQIFDDIASALAYAHEEGMVHRGVKPSNIIVLRSGAAKIGDFGIGQIGQAALRYMSPEQVRCEPLDHRSDIFSLGAVFYEMLTRRPAFEGSSPKEIMENILHAEPPPPSKVNPHVPGALDAIVSRMLARLPDERFANARIVLRDLQRLEEALGLGPGASAGSGEPAASAPPGAPEARLRTPGINRSPDRQVAHEISQPETKREPTLRMPDPDRFRDAFRADSLAAEELQHRSRIPGGMAFDEHEARFVMDREARRERSSGSGAAKLAALALTFVVLPLGFAFYFYYSPGPGEPRIPATRMQEPPAAAAPSRVAAPPPVAEAAKEPAVEPATAPAAPEAPPRAIADAEVKQAAPPPVAEAAKKPATDPATKQESAATAPAPSPVPPQPLVAEPSAPAKTEKLLPRESEQPAIASAAPAKEAPRATQPKASIAEPQPGGAAKLIIAIEPQGELYIDGKHYGTTPPITTLDLEPGMYRIEVRSGSRKPYVTYMAVQAGEQRRIRHDFTAKIRPPT
jgi:serine/threonine protein kinase